MARRRRRRNKVPGDRVTPDQQDGGPFTENLSPRARRLVESGVIDPAGIEGTGEDGRVTSGDILLAARVIEKERSIARIEAVDSMSTGTGGVDATIQSPAVEPSPWDAYNGTTEGLASSAMHGAEQSWGEAEALLAAGDAFGGGDAAAPADQPIVVELAASPEPGREDTEQDMEQIVPEMSNAGMDPATPEPEEVEPAAEPIVALEEPDGPSVVLPAVDEAGVGPVPAAIAAAGEESAEAAAIAAAGEESGEAAGSEPGDAEPGAAAGEDAIAAGAPINFGTLEFVDPFLVWKDGADNLAPWFLAHASQIADVLGMPSGLAAARLYTTKSAVGVIGIDENGDDVVVVSTEHSIAEDADLGRALGMAASSGAASIALISAGFGEEQLQALAWLNSQTKSGVKWYGVETQVVRIGDSPVAMLFDLVAAPPPSAS